MGKPISDPTVLGERADTPCTLIADLAVMLGGSADSFTGELLNLCGKADPPNLGRLAIAFPLTVTVYRAWMNHPDPTHRDVSHMIAAAQRLAIRENGASSDRL